MDSKKKTFENNGGSLKGFLFMSFISFKQCVYA